MELNRGIDDPRIYDQLQMYIRIRLYIGIYAIEHPGERKAGAIARALRMTAVIRFLMHESTSTDKWLEDVWTTRKEADP